MTTRSTATIPSDASASLRGVADICLALPAAEATSHTGQHYAFQVRAKAFVYYLIDHHGDGRTAISFKAPRGMSEVLIENDPRRFYRAAYLAQHGWVCLDLEAAPIDWDEVREFVLESYCLVAPKRLATQSLAPAGQRTESGSNS